ncbi:MAG: cation diffusion facilitator family transporter [Syntrophotaleaceae bacterium]
MMETSERTAFFSILTNASLVAIKSALAIFSGSLAIKADAIHSLTDVISAVIVLVGIKISKRRSRNFPYGLYKIENLVALGTALLIFVAGYEIVEEVFTRESGILLSNIPLAAGGIGLSILITWLFSRYELKKGLETGSPSLIADARHVWADMLSSVVILISLLGSAFGLVLDRYAALIVVVFIAKAAIHIFLDAVRVLLDASLDYESMNRIRDIVKADPRVVKTNEIRARNAGRYKFVELDLVLRVRELKKGHSVAEEIKQRIKCELENVDHVQIHYEPQKKDHLMLSIPLCEDRQTISDHFGEAPFFRVLNQRTSDGVITSDSILTNDHVQEEKAKGIKVANWLLQEGLDVLILRKDLAGKGAGFALGNADVEILITKEFDADKALAGIIPQRELKKEA